MNRPLTVLEAQSPPDGSSLENELRALVRGEVRFTDQDRMLYSTDASIYQVSPIGVVVPADAQDVSQLLRFCNERKIPILPRGGGTSLAGQCVNRAVVCDLSAHFRSPLKLDSAKQIAQVQTGMSIDEVNRWLAAQGTNLFFAPDPATVAQCAIGGAIGNNAAGARSIRYGRTSENIAALEVVLASGQQLWLSAGAGRNDPVAGELAARIAAIARRYAPLIRQRFPKLNRRNAGYGIDLIVRQLDSGVADEDLDLTGMICGSEGTLAIVTSAKLKLHPIPRAKGLAILSFCDLEAAVDAVAPILETGTVAVELLDEEVLTAADGNRDCRPYLDLIEPIDGHRPRAVLYVEYQNETEADHIAPGFDRLRAILPGVAGRFYRDTISMARAWALRKAGEPLLHGLSAHRKPLTFVEDNSIPIAQLPRFIREFKAIVAAHGTRAAYWAHASVGVLHVRPMLDLHDEADRERVKSIAQQVADLARDCGGVMSGEHGDGRVRGPLLQRFFGPELMQCFAEIKAVFDPRHILNPGMIVDAGPIDSITEHLRVQPGQTPVTIAPVETYFDFSDQEGFQGAVEMCNGAGFCRKTAGGTMCPSYRGTLDERHSTRGRGNALRLAISGQLRRDGSGRPDFDDAGTMQTLDLCLSCKACKSECPSNVDIARLKAEYTAQRYRQTSPPLSARAFGHVRRLNQIMSLAPALANAVNSLLPVRWVLNRLLHVAPQRSLPPVGKSLYRQFRSTVKFQKTHGSAVGFKREKPTALPWVRSNDPEVVPNVPRLVLFGDCFVTYNEPDIGLAAMRVLRALGYEVLLPRVGCCGRAMISNGLLADAIATADGTLDDLRPFIEDPNVRAILVAEPSCLSAFKDDWLQLKLRTPREQREKLAGKSWLIEEFIDRFWDDHPRRPEMSPDSAGPRVILHGHCHQKALWGDQTSGNALRRFCGDRVTTLDSGCCGMAGSFGYAAQHYDLSMKIGELSVFPPILASAADAIITAPGTSCRHQIHDGAARRALHPIEVIDRLM
jgi:FAD/FMN-containing dehydrogenase/Fe-S oxidoreductase